MCTHGGKKITVVEQSVDEPVGEGGGGHGILRGGKGRVYQGVNMVYHMEGRESTDLPLT